MTRVGLEPTTHGLKAGIAHSARSVPPSEGFVSARGDREGIRPHTGHDEWRSRELDGKRTTSGPSRLRSVTGGADRLLTVRQVAEKLGLCTRSVYEIVGRGEVAHVRITNAIRVAPADLEDFIRRNRRKS